MPTRSRTRLPGCALLAVLACGSPRRDLGETADGMLDEMPSSACEEVSPAARDGERQAAHATLLSDFVGVWLGQAEDALGDVGPDGTLPAYFFPSGSTSILLEVSHTDRVAAKPTFGAAEPSLAPPLLPLPSLAPSSGASRSGADSAPPPIEGFAYPAEPVASALDVARAAEDEVQGEPLALDGKLVLAFSLDAGLVSELFLRFGGEGLVGAFDGLPLLNERGFLTRPGSVRFGRVAERSD